MMIEDGSWRGHRAWIGPQLPNTKEPGQLWFDTVEIVLMMSVPREPPGPDWSPKAIERWRPLWGWLSLNPVAVWQHHAYIKLAKPSMRAALSQRIVSDADETTPVTSVSGTEARGFASWMGKWLPSQYLWQEVHDRMGAEIFNRTWGTSGKEWCSDGSGSIALSRETLHADIDLERDADDLPAPELRMLYSGGDGSPEIGFRTRIHDKIGLLVSEPGFRCYRR